MSRNKIIAANIRRYIEQNGITQKKLAESIGIRPSTLSDYLNLRSNPSHGVIQKMADYFGVLKSDIDTTFKDTETDGINFIYNQLDDLNKTKVYNYAEYRLEKQNKIKEENLKYISTGRGTAAGSALYVDDSDARKEVLPASIVPNGADELVEVVGQSMEPLIQDGEEVYIRYQPTVEQGEIAIVRIDGEGVTCKRVYVDGDTVTLKSENEDYEDMYFSADQITVLGKVLL